MLLVFTCSYYLYQSKTNFTCVSLRWYRAIPPSGPY